MLILGDIGNSVTKLFLVNSKDKILKKTSLPSKSITNSILNRILKRYYFVALSQKLLTLLKDLYQKKLKLSVMK